MNKLWFLGLPLSLPTGGMIAVIYACIAGYYHQHHPRFGIYPPQGDQHHEIRWRDQRIYPDSICG